MNAAEPPQPPPAGPAPAAPPPRRRRRPALLIALVLLLLPLAALVGAGYAVYHHAAPLAWLMQRVPGLSLQGLGGSLASRQLQIEQFDLTLPGELGRLQISGLRAQGWTLALRGDGRWWPELHLQKLHADSLSFSGGASNDAPLTAPQALRLPATLRVDQLSIDTLTIGQLPRMHALQVELALGADQGRQHRIGRIALQVDVGAGQEPSPLDVEGSLAIGGEAPLPAQATLRLRRPGAERWHAELQAGGSLARLSVAGRLSGVASARAAAPQIDVSATVLPFAPWPLAALALQTQALDLSALSARLPATQLSGQAQVSSSGLDQVAVVKIDLDNARPGSWDQGALPLRRLQLQASGEPRQTDRLTLDHFLLQLADARGAAGRIGGRGQWQAENLALTLQLDGLRPAQLDRRAAPLELAGTLAVKVGGLPLAAQPSGATDKPATSRASLRLALDGQLSGHLIDGSGQSVQLRLVGDASASHLHIGQAEARSGDATAALTLDARAVAAGWQLRGQAALGAFDPRPWWRGAEGSVWRRGPHRFDARLDADLLWRHATATGASGSAATDAAARSLGIDRWLARLDGHATLTLPRGQLAGVPVDGEMQLRSDGAAARINARADLGGNRLTLEGRTRGNAAADAWQLDVQAPRLASIAAWGPLLDEWLPGLGAQWPSQGAVTGQLRTQGRWPEMHSQADLQASGLASALGTLARAQASWRLGDGLDAPLSLQLQAEGLAQGERRIDRLTVEASGTPRQHRVTLALDSPLRPPAWTETLLGPVGSGTQLQVSSQGAWQPGPSRGLGGGSYRVSALTLRGGRRAAPATALASALASTANRVAAAAASAPAPAAAASAPRPSDGPWLAADGLELALQLDAAGRPASLQLAPGTVKVLNAGLSWREASWQAAAGARQHALVALSAELEAIQVAKVLALAQPQQGWSGNLTLGGHLEMHSAAAVEAEMVFRRLGGDLALTDEFGVRQSMGLSELHLALTVRDGVWQFAQGLAGRRIGTLAGAQVLNTTSDRLWPPGDAALQGVLEARVADLGVWGAWVPPGWRLSGALETIVQLGGHFGAPEVSGTMRGNQLGVRNVLEGVELTDGDLSLALQGDHAHIERMRFKAGEGWLTLSGEALLGAAPSARIDLVAEHFRVLGRLDRRLLVSGQARLELERDKLRLDGDVHVDEGRFNLARGEAPKLDADVVVRKRSTGAEQLFVVPPAATSRPVRNAQVTLRINLGDKLRLSGFGIDTQLRGALQVSTPDGKLALNGSVRADEGRYAAYGQKLEVSRGVLTFTGPPENPELDVLAVRPNLDVTVGVEVSGTAQHPRVRLYSEPDMSDTDKLSWLIMGRAPDGLGSTDTAMLQRMAFALLAGEEKTPTDTVLDAIGLTDFSIRPADGTTQQTVVSLGKQLTQRWYVGYERGVNATTGNWQVIYRLAQRFTLRAQTGNDNAVDFIWTWRW